MAFVRASWTPPRVASPLFSLALALLLCACAAPCASRPPSAAEQKARQQGLSNPLLSPKTPFPAPAAELRRAAMGAPR